MGNFTVLWKYYCSTSLQSSENEFLSSKHHIFEVSVFHRGISGTLKEKSYVVVKFEDRLFHLSTGIVKIKAICNFLVMCTSAIPKPFSSDYKSHQSSLLFRQSIGICQGKIMNFLFGILILVLAVQGEADAEDQVNATLLRKLQEFMDIPRIVDQFPHRATLQKSPAAGGAQFHPKFSPELYRTVNLLALRSQHLISVLNNLGSVTGTTPTSPTSPLRLY